MRSPVPNDRDNQAIEMRLPPRISQRQNNQQHFFAGGGQSLEASWEPTADYQYGKRTLKADAVGGERAPLRDIDEKSRAPLWRWLTRCERQQRVSGVPASALHNAE